MSYEYCTRCDGFRNPNYSFPFCTQCAGDWICCREQQWARQKVCKTCYKPKPERKLLSCLNCGNKQYWNRVCNNCKDGGPLVDSINLDMKLEEMPALKKHIKLKSKIVKTNSIKKKKLNNLNIF